PAAPTGWARACRVSLRAALVDVGAALPVPSITSAVRAGPLGVTGGRTSGVASAGSRREGRRSTPGGGALVVFGVTVAGGGASAGAAVAEPEVTGARSPRGHGRRRGGAARAPT